MAQMVKNPPAMQETRETQVRSLGQEDPLEKEMATCSSILAWEIPCTKLGGLQSMAWQRDRHDRATKQQQRTSLNRKMKKQKKKKHRS